MIWDATEARIAGEFALAVRFRDGLEGAVKFLPTFFRGACLPNRTRFPACA